MKRLVTTFVLLLAAVALAQPKASKSPALLPDIFAGWQKSAGAQASHDAAAADPINAKVLAEYGFIDFEAATYTRDSRQMKVKAARFKDATGAYGAFTFFKTPEMQTEKFGDQGASSNEHVMFYRGNLLVTADLDRVTAMSAGELRELAEDLPLPADPSRNPPTLPMYLPKQGYVSNSAKYAIGPEALASINSPLNAQEINFSTGAEVALGHYASDAGNATVEIVSYPTPAIAAERLKSLQATHPESAAQPMFSKRTGPLLAVVTGAVSPREAKSLLASINYDANIVWNEPTYLGPKNNVGNLLVGIVALIGVILAMALVAGIAFGGFRLLMKRFYPDSLFDRSKDIEIIELKLR